MSFWITFIGTWTTVSTCTSPYPSNAFTNYFRINWTVWKLQMERCLFCIWARLTLPNDQHKGYFIHGQLQDFKKKIISDCNHTQKPLVFHREEFWFVFEAAHIKFKVLVLLCGLSGPKGTPEKDIYFLNICKLQRVKSLWFKVSILFRAQRRQRFY